MTEPKLHFVCPSVPDWPVEESQQEVADVGVPASIVEGFDRQLEEFLTDSRLASDRTRRDGECREIKVGIPDLDEIGIDNADQTIVDLEKIARVQVPVHNVIAT